MENRKTYLQKLNAALTEVQSNWWNSLSKEELLDFIRDNEHITADLLRSIFATQELVIVGKTSFNTDSAETAIDFNSRD